jgi:8-oxo-dGTP diphosphatase
MLHVVIGILFNANHQVLIAERQLHQDKGGLWEFPGGKLEPGEMPSETLSRELTEELGIHVISAHPWLELPFDYSDKSVFLDVWIVTQFSTNPVGAEGQAIRWVPLADLQKFRFPGGNTTIIEKLMSLDLSQLPFSRDID